MDNIVWGPLNTTISGKIGDIIGVVRDKDFAIGMFGIDDNTITGAVEEGDCYQMGYYIHSEERNIQKQQVRLGNPYRP